MIDPVYTLAGLAGVDSEENTITGIQILDHNMTVWYKDASGGNRFITLRYDLEN